ncbi:MAG: response regulator [Flavobacterium sp.]|uniref:response regulator n=1 Tax=Flavobacterium sp. TaxID=239 RepID=UPI0012117346|nr:response regulator [Flavobacterium sp.]RZJ65943.1 MAG: response regulator [Flavobacterium sp.]
MASPKQCFFIDDDADDQDFFCDAAHTIDSTIQCTFANNGIEAMSRLSDENFSPDVIFIDMNMPMMGGRETLEEIRKINRLNKTAIYVYSTGVAPNVAEEMLALGATEFLTKPSNMTDLQQLLEKILK